jgi:CPA2 family monovalent cation:H+ antiporter-2
VTETAAALFLKDLAILFGVAALATIVFERFRLPIIAGYLVAGIVLGPHVGPALITDSATVRVLAEVGVVLILGSVGLEFRLRRLLRLGPRVGLTAVIEVGFMLAVGIGLATALGWGRLERLLAGGIVAISSTAVIAKVFEERAVDRRLKDLVFGVLVMEDLVAIVLIAIAAAASLGTSLDVRSIGAVLLRMGGVLLAILAAGLLLVPRTIRAVVRLGRPETTLVTAVGLTFLVAVLTETAGYSVALGAFLAGLLMAESGVGHQVTQVLKPVRDLFAAVFFVAVGMLLDVRAALAAWPLVLGFTAIVVLGKISSVSVGAFLNGFGARNSIRAGMSLAQIGEFSFILAGLGGSQATGAAPLYSIAVATAMITSFVTPWLVGRSDRAAAWIDRRLPGPLQTFSSLYGAWLEASAERRAAGGPGQRANRLVRLVVVDAMFVAAALILTSIGYRRGVPWLDRFALTSAVTRLVVLAAGAAVALPFGFGLMLAIRRLARLLGDAAVPPVGAGKVDQGLAPRQLFVITVEITVVIAIGIPLVLVTLPFLPPLGAPGVVVALLLLLGVAFWRTARNLDSHARAGAELVVHVLGKQVAHGDTGQFAVVRGMLPGMGDLAPFVVEAGSVLDGKTLGELDVRGRTGATIVAIARGRERHPFPKASERVLAGDLIAVTGTHDAVMQAEALGRAIGTRTPPTDTASTGRHAERGSGDGEGVASDTPAENPSERRDR